MAEAAGNDNQPDSVNNNNPEPVIRRDAPGPAARVLQLPPFVLQPESRREPDPQPPVPVEEPPPIQESPDQDDDSLSLKPFVFQPFALHNSQPQEHVRHPAPRSGHRIVADNDYIYLIGGYNQDVSGKYLRHLETDPLWAKTKPIFSELWRFSKLTRIWERVPTSGDHPTELISHCMALWDKKRKLLIYGGSGTPFGQANSNKMYMCDLRTFVWERVHYANENEADYPKAGYGQAMAVDEENHCIYVCGGTQGYEYTMDMHKFDFCTRKWELLHPTINYTNLPARYRHEMALYKNKLYIIGGANNGVAYGVDNIPTFNLETNKWTLTKSRPFGADMFPNPRYAFGGAQYGGAYHVFGGTDVRHELSDFWTLHLQNLNWQLHTANNSANPSARFFFSMTISPNGQLAIFGGVDKARTRFNDVYHAWVTIPPLYAIAREAVVQNVKVISAKQAKLEETEGGDSETESIAAASTTTRRSSSSTPNKRRKAIKLTVKSKKGTKAKAKSKQDDQDVKQVPGYMIFTREKLEQFQASLNIPARNNLLQLPGF